MKLRFLLATCVCIVATIVAVSCSSSKENQSLTLATTTSARDTGLLDVLVPLFRTQTGIEVKVVAVGSGHALELGRRGDADVLLVHDPAGEQRFMEEGFGARRDSVMYNEFVLAGPTADPARVKGEGVIAEAFARISHRGALFVSRADESGTHQKEKAIWRQAGIEPQGDWYLRAGAGMGQVLRMASEKRAYTLCDRGTFLAQRKGLDLEILSEGDPLLVNPYGVIVVSPDKHPHVRSESARKFADFLLSTEGRKTIGDFGKDKYGQPLFFVGQPKN
jgi:tungstate transport system substrate-binding protein